MRAYNASPGVAATDTVIFQLYKPCKTGTICAMQNPDGGTALGVVQAHGTTRNNIGEDRAHMASTTSYSTQRYPGVIAMCHFLNGVRPGVQRPKYH